MMRFAYIGQLLGGEELEEGSDNVLGGVQT